MSYDSALLPENHAYYSRFAGICCVLVPVNSIHTHKDALDWGTGM